MTLVILESTHRHSIIASDRRLTVNGQLRDDASNKAIVVTTPIFTILFGFTGLAVAGSFNTRNFLRDEIFRLIKYPVGVQDFVTGLQDALNKVFSKPPLRGLSEKNKLLQIGAVGAEIYRDKIDQLNSQSLHAVISNVNLLTREYLGTFSATVQPVGQGYAILGQRVAITDEDVLQVNDLVNKRAPFGTIAGKMADRIRAASRRASAGGTIGDKVSWVALDRQTMEVVFGQYPESTIESYSPTFVLSSISGPSMLEGLSVTGPMQKHSLPPFERSQPCPCKSGAQYRRCHGRQFQMVNGLASPISQPGSELVYPIGYAEWEVTNS